MVNGTITADCWCKHMILSHLAQKSSVKDIRNTEKSSIFVFSEYRDYRS